MKEEPGSPSQHPKVSPQVHPPEAPQVHPPEAPQVHPPEATQVHPPEPPRSSQREDAPKEPTDFHQTKEPGDFPEQVHSNENQVPLDHEPKHPEDSGLETEMGKNENEQSQLYNEPSAEQQNLKDKPNYHAGDKDEENAYFGDSSEEESRDSHEEASQDSSEEESELAKIIDLAVKGLPEVLMSELREEAEAAEKEIEDNEDEDEEPDEDEEQEDQQYSSKSAPEPAPREMTPEEIEGTLQYCCVTQNFI